MRKLSLYFLSLFLLGLTWACVKDTQKKAAPEAAKFCTQDVKECEDGSFVPRNPDQNCEFKACP